MHPDIDDRTTWHPVRLGPSPLATPVLEELCEARAWRTMDVLEAQLEELVLLRNPGAKFTHRERAEAVARLLDGRPLSDLGIWFALPWRRVAVHVLTEELFREVRLDRNRHKILANEQRILGGKQVGIVGLSVGSAALSTMVMEGIGTRFRLADFDQLYLGNLNRIHASIFDYGINKAVIAARRAFEIDPFLEIDIWPDGLVDDEDIDAFLTRGGPLDLVVEECDDLQIKVRLRERARDLRIPVIMDTSDRGLLDIERFDREPERAVLHGLLAGARADDLRSLTDEQKVPYILRLLDERAVSSRAAASMLEVKETIASWPQLASGVTLGAALVADSARRVLLGQMQRSGRFHVDLETLVSDESSEDPTRDELLVAIPPPEAFLPRAAPPTPLAHDGLMPSREEIRYLIAHAITAPSGGNVQPWMFRWDGRALVCSVDTKRAWSFLDFERRASVAAIGACVENIVIAAAALGWKVRVDSTDRAHVATLHFERAGARDGDARLDAIWARVTDRSRSPRVPLAREQRDRLEGVARSRGCELRLVESPEVLATLGEIVGEIDRLQYTSKTMHREMLGEMRWSAADAVATRTGMDVASLQMSATDLAALKIVAQWRVMDQIRAAALGRALVNPSRKAFVSSSAGALLTCDAPGRNAYFEGGRGMQAVWLAATTMGIGLHPMSASLYLFARLAAGGEGLTKDETGRLTELRARFETVFPASEPRATEVLLFRLFPGSPPNARSLRLPVDDVLCFI